MMRLARNPVLHFLVLGGALYLVQARWGAGEASLRPATVSPQAPISARLVQPAAPTTGSRTVTISAAQIEILREGWRRSHRQPPMAAEEARLIEGLVAEEMLYREALAHGLDRAEPVRQRLIQNMRFLQIDPVEKVGTEDLYRQAVEIGFDRTDPVVRRYLIEQMRLLVRAGDRPDTFTDAELREYLQRNAARFSVPAFVRLSHVFLDADRRGESMERDARRLLARLRDGRISPEAAPELGDPFFPGHHPALAERTDLEKIFGAGFAAEAMVLPESVWSGPLRSAYGLHLVWVHQIVPGEPPRLADVRSRLALELAHERQEARLAAFLSAMRRRYEVQIEEVSR